MDKDLTLVLVGGVIGLVSSLVSVFLTYRFEDKRFRAQMARDDELRREERERDDALRKEQRERDDQLRWQDRRREANAREIDALWRDIQRLREKLAEANNAIAQNHLQKDILDLTRRRDELLEEHRGLVYGARQGSPSDV